MGHEENDRHTNRYQWTGGSVEGSRYMHREDWDYFVYKTCAEHSNIRNSENIKEGARVLERMEVTLKPLVTCCNLLSRRKPEYIKPEIVHIYIS